MGTVQLGNERTGQSENRHAKGIYHGTTDILRDNASHIWMGRSNSEAPCLNTVARFSSACRCAAKSGHADMVELLLANGADVCSICFGVPQQND